MSYIEHVAFRFFLFYTVLHLWQVGYFLFHTWDFSICLFIFKRSTLFIIGARKSNCKQQVGISNVYKLSHVCRLYMIKLNNQYKNRKTKLIVDFKNSWTLKLNDINWFSSFVGQFHWIHFMIMWWIFWTTIVENRQKNIM